jgi:hypothetical protein
LRYYRPRLRGNERKNIRLMSAAHAPCERAVLSAAEAVSQSGIPIAILAQPAPHGVPALSHQIRHQPSSNRTRA